MGPRSVIRRYKKKPVTIKAIQFTDESILDVVGWIRANNGQVRYDLEPPRLSILTLESTNENAFECTLGDFIIQGVQGEFYACKPEIFVETYEDVTDDV